METLPKALADEIESLEELDARALKRKYPALLSDAGDCSASGILRCIVAYRLQEKYYGRPLAEDAKSWLEADDGGDGPRLRTAVSGSGARARLVRVWKGVRHEAVVRNDGRFEYNGEIFNSLSAIAKVITGTHWNGRLFFGIK